ncbi:ABC transporter substrate-binding protein [Myxococcota bacterium]|nr:ABC transporter substrate-binding protein [Myxococcota bacterium]
MGEGKAPEADAGPVDGDMLVVDIGLDPGHLVPIVLPYQVSGQISHLVDLGPTERRFDAGRLEFRPDLALAPERSEDGLTVTYRMKPGAVWEDGTPVTARDFAFTWEMTCDEAVASNWLGDCKAFADPKAPVEVVDDRTARVAFRTLRDPLLQDSVLHRTLLPRHVLESADRKTLRGHDFGRAPLANGAFRVERYDPDREIVLVPNPKSGVRSRPHLSRVVFRVVPEYTSRVIDLESGAIDLLPDLEVGDLQRIRRDPRLDVVKIGHNSLAYVGYNLADPLFADPRVRRALGLAADVDAIVRSVYTAGDETLAVRAVGTVSPAFQGAVPGDLEPLPHDPGRAKALLAEAGWADTDHDGVLDRGGKPLAFRLLLQASAAAERKVATILQAQWKGAGVAVEIEAIEENAFIGRIREKRFEAMIWGFGAEPRLEESIKFHSGSRGQYNWGGYRNPEVDAALEARLAARTPEEVLEAVHRVQRLVYADQPMTFLVWKPDLVAIDRRFRGVAWDSYSPYLDLEKWWVPKGEQKYRY